MKISFVTGSLEPGRTGVGDYTRLLAGACRELGHEVQTIGLNDHFIPSKWEGLQDDIPCLRFPESLTWEYKWQRASRFVDKFDPDWVSLQFVPYAFHDKGLFNEFLRGFSKLTGKRRVQIKFHEIWIGEYPGAPMKEKVAGYLQKRLIRKLIKDSRPHIIHYTNAGAKVRMERAGIPASHLPIFGNIKVTGPKTHDWLYQQLVSAGKRVTKDSIREFVWFGFFGSIHPKWPARQILERLRMNTMAQDKRPGLLHAGILGKHRKRWGEIKNKYSGDWLIHSIGELPGEEISQYLMTLDYGLTSTPWDLVGKSGTIAAMVEHGLPVIINVEGGTPDAPLVIQEQFQPLIIRSDQQLLQKLAKPVHHNPVANNVTTVAHKFLQSLERRNNHAQILIA
mgnify:CR=1 FL=1